MKGLLLRSMKNKEKIIIFYLDSRGRVTERCISVLQIRDSHIVAYCYFRNKVRTFKVANILSAGPARTPRYVG